MTLTITAECNMALMFMSVTEYYSDMAFSYTVTR